MSSPGMPMCHHCSSNPAVICSRESGVCSDCFEDSLLHRFRRELGTCDLYQSRGKVIVALSGGPNSRCVLELLRYCLSRISTRNMRFELVAVHIDVDCVSRSELLHGDDESAGTWKTTIIKQCVADTWPELPLYVIPLENVLDSEDEFKSKLEPVSLEVQENGDEDEDRSSKNLQKLKEAFTDIVMLEQNQGKSKAVGDKAPSEVIVDAYGTQYDILLKTLVHKTLDRAACCMDCVAVISGETVERLSAEVFTGVCTGRAGMVHVVDSLATVPQSYYHIPRIAPLRDVMDKEVLFFLKSNGLLSPRTVVLSKNAASSSSTSSSTSDVNGKPTVTSLVSSWISEIQQEQTSTASRSVVACAEKVVKMGFHGSTVNTTKTVSVGSCEAGCECERKIASGVCVFCHTHATAGEGEGEGEVSLCKLCRDRFPQSVKLLVNSVF